MSADKKELKELLEYYEQNLCHKIFKYELNNTIDIEIIFYVEGLCHLLGIQHVFKSDRRYLGKRGYDLIKTGKLTRVDLKKHNKAEYKKLELKLAHFDEIGELLSAGTFLKFYPQRANPRTQIRADFLVHRDNKEQYIKNQEYKKVTAFEIVRN